MSYDDNTVSVSELDDGIMAVEAAGEIDASSAPRLQRALLSVLREGHDRVVLDLSKVTFMDSSAIGAVIAAYAEAKERQAGFVVVCGGGHAAKRLQVMGLNSLLEPVESRAEARARLGSPA